MTLDQLIKDFLEVQLSINQWNLKKTAESIGVYRQRLYRLIKRHKIEREQNDIR